MSTFDLDAIERSCAEFRRAIDIVAAQREQMNFGSRLTRAVKAKLQSRLQPRFTAVATAEPNDDGGFGEQLKKAVKRKASNSPQRHKEQAERERSRYPQRRKATKGE